MIGVPMKGTVIMMAKQTIETTRKNHYYVACWGYGVGVTDDNGQPFVGVLVFDGLGQARDYAARYEWVDGHTYAEVIGARGAKVLMRRQLIAKLWSMLSDDVDRVVMAGKVRRMGVAELVGEYRMFVFR